LRGTLVSLDTDYHIGDEPRFEVTIENAGSSPLRVLFSPHLADLQPQDPAQKFAYSEGKGQLSLPANDMLPAGHPLVVDHVYAKVSLYRTESLSTPTATAIVSREVCLKNVQGKGLPISLTTPNQ
jgi:hypothetical protein